MLSICMGALYYMTDVIGLDVFYMTTYIKECFCEVSHTLGTGLLYSSVVFNQRVVSAHTILYYLGDLNVGHHHRDHKQTSTS